MIQLMQTLSLHLQTVKGIEFTKYIYNNVNVQYNSPDASKRVCLLIS